MRIAVLTNAYPPDAPGGASRIAEVQVRILEQAGHEVRVWHPRIAWFADPAAVRLAHHLKDLGARKDLEREIRDWKPDLLLTHNLTGCGFATSKKIKRRGVRWMHVLHDVQLFEPSGRTKNARIITPWQEFWSFLRWMALGKPDLVLSPTDWLLRQHRRRGLFWRTPFAILPNPCPPMQRIARTPHRPLRLLYVGRIAPDKGSRILVFLARQPDNLFELTIIGHGPDADLFKGLPAGRFRFLGVQPTEEILRQMAEHDALLVPSLLEENQPTVLLEAASVGLPVLVTAKAGMLETLQGAGIVCPDRRSGKWIDAIKSLTDPVTYRRESEAMLEVANRHDPEIYRQRFLSLLKSNR